jgi:hypothetical protein
MNLRLEGRDVFEQQAPWWTVDDLGDDMVVEVQAFTKSEARARLKNKLKAERIPRGTSLSRKEIQDGGKEVAPRS